MTTRKASRKATQIGELIRAGAVARVSDKNGAFLGYLVKSDSQPNTYYELTWDAAALAWQCSCPATKRCKHIEAVCSICRARRELGKSGACCQDKEVEVSVPAQAASIAAIFVSDAHKAALHITEAEPFNAAAVLAEYADVIDEAERPQPPEGSPARRQEAKRREEAALNPGRAFSILRV
jgi:hypothetical protein